MAKRIESGRAGRNGEEEGIILIPASRDKDAKGGEEDPDVRQGQRVWTPQYHGREVE